VVKLFGHRQRLPGDVRAALRTHLGSRPHVLAWATATDGVLVALPDRLARRDATGWSEVPWHDVLTGGWDAADRSLHWTRLSTGERVQVPLTEPGSLPEVFRERVEATILFRRVVYPVPGQALTIAARRNLVDDSRPVQWTVHPSRGLRMDDPAVVAFAEAELARLRAEYAF